MILEEMASFLGERIKKQSPSGTHASYLKKEISEAAKQHINLNYNWNELNVDSTLSVTSATLEYLLALDFGRMNSMWHKEDSVVSDIPKLTKKYFKGNDLSTTLTGTAQKFYINRQSGVTGTISSASVVTLQSTESSDTNIDIRIYGMVNGLPTYETVTTHSSNGTTASSGSKSFSEIYYVTKSKTSSGEITVSVVPDEIVVIPSGFLTTNMRYTYIKLYPIPDADITVYYNYKRKQFDISDNNDSHILSDAHDNAILKLAEYNIYKNLQVLKDYKSISSDLKKNEPVNSSNNIIQNLYSMNKLPWFNREDIYVS